MLVCIVVLCQSTWTKMQYPVALFQKRSQIESIGIKCLFMISAGCLFPSLIYPRTICKLKKEPHALSTLLKTKQRTAVLSAGHEGNFRLSCIFPQHVPQAHTTTCCSSAWSQGFVVSCAVFFSWLLSHPEGPNGPRNTAGQGGEEMKPQRTSLLFFILFIQQDYTALLCQYA